MTVKGKQRVSYVFVLVGFPASIGVRLLEVSGLSHAHSLSDVARLQ